MVALLNGKGGDFTQGKNRRNFGGRNIHIYDEENNQQNALINSSINLLMSDHSDMFRLPS
jgi:hypothetical protein